MKCSSCQTENPGSRKFCRECGGKLLLVCPKCKAENLPGDKFCGDCRQPFQPPCIPVFEESSFDEKILKIQKYLPKGLTKKILSQKDEIEGEKRYLTVLFCDMVGFTSLCEELEPERVYTLMEQVYEILIYSVNTYEGTVNEMTGDGIMALFGAPIALEDGPQRAIRAALAIQKEITRFSDRTSKEQEGAPIRMRIGIHSGPVVVGTLGNDLRVDFKAVGDTVNLASRMQTLAEPGTIYVTENTFKLTEGLFRFEALGKKQIKGKTGLLRIYQVIAPSTRRTRFDVSAERGLTPFVGRDRELGLLLDALDRAKAGSYQAFSIIGGPGMGKSRLLYEFRKVVGNADITFLECRCLSYGKSVTYHPIADLLKGSFDIRNDDSDEQIRKKVENALEVLKADIAATIPYLLELLAVRDSGIDKIPMSPEGRKERIIEAVKQIILKAAQIRPLIIAIEDLHWADETTEETLKWLLESTPRSRVLVIFTYRPEFEHTWGGRSFHNQVYLNRLSNRESLLMVSSLLGTDTAGPILQRLILDKTEGVPFFIEEFVKSLQDLDVIEKVEGQALLLKDPQLVAIPSTIQDIIMAKVDQLSDAVKAVLQAGATIEREFSYGLIKRILGIGETELLACLDLLKKSELIYERDIHPDNTYVFRHAMTREVVYDSILTRTKMRFHESIGNAIEQLHGEKLEEQYGPLVNHFTVSGNYRKVAEYSWLAYIKAESALSLNEASVFAKKWIDALEKLPTSETLLIEIIKARTVLGFLQFRMSNMADAKECVDPIADMYLRHNLKTEQGQAWVIMGSYKCMVEEELVESIRYLEKAIGITEETEDVIISAYAQYMLGLVLAFNCDFEKAIHYFEILLGLSEALAFDWRISVMKSNLSIYGYIYHGMVTEGYQSSRDAVDIAEESGDIYSKAMAYPSHGVSCYYKGLLKEALRNLEKGVDYTEKINMAAHNALAHQYLGHVYIQQGKFQKARKHYEKTIRNREKSRLFPSSANLNRIALARAKCLGGEKVMDFDCIYRYARENRVKIYEGTVARYIGEILLHAGDQSITLAEFWIEKAIQANTQNGMRCNLGWDYVLYSEFFLKMEKLDKAKNCIERAIGIFKICGADGWVQKLEERLSGLWF